MSSVHEAVIGVIVTVTVASESSTGLSMLARFLISWYLGFEVHSSTSTGKILAMALR